MKYKSLAAPMSCLNTCRRHAAGHANLHDLPLNRLRSLRLSLLATMPSTPAERVGAKKDWEPAIGTLTKTCKMMRNNFVRKHGVSLPSLQILNLLVPTYGCKQCPFNFRTWLKTSTLFLELPFLRFDPQILEFRSAGNGHLF